jgi:pyrroline-5-carboxylate reductase
MGGAIIEGLLRAGWKASDISVVELSQDRRNALQKMFPGINTSEAIGACSSAVIAVKPGGAIETCAALSKAGATRVLSIAAGVSAAALQNAAGAHTSVVRAMPNTPALIGEGMAGICATESTSEEVLQWAESVLGAVGKVVRVPESLIDAVTAISGSGPAYIFLVAEALTTAAIEQGLSAEVANTLVRQLFVGSAQLLSQSSESPEQLRANVTSPNGVTAAAIATLEAAGLRDAISQTVKSAVQRSREMGK